MTKLSFCQNNPPMSTSFWQKDTLVTLILFEKMPIMIFSLVSNSSNHPLVSAETIWGNTVNIFVWNGFIVESIEIPWLIDTRYQSLKSVYFCILLKGNFSYIIPIHISIENKRNKRNQLPILSYVIKFSYGNRNQLFSNKID